MAAGGGKEIESCVWQTLGEAFKVPLAGRQKLGQGVDPLKLNTMRGEQRFWPLIVQLKKDEK